MIGLKVWTIEDRLTHSYWILKRHLLHPLNANWLAMDCGKTLKWIDLFLCLKQQRVVVNGVKSGLCAPVLSGASPPPHHGTVISPVLFFLCLNDISSGVESKVRLCAYDCVCYREIKDEENTMKIIGILIDWDAGQENGV